MNKKLWGGRFREATASVVDRFNASIGYDYRLYSYDIEGSIAHAEMLAAVGLLKTGELEHIVNGLQEIKKDIDKGTFEFKEEYEDIHMNIEAALTERIGPVGGKLHTGRSRNDQVALDLRLYIRDKINQIIEQTRKVQSALVSLARDNFQTVLPGYTHLQRAQPVLLAHHLLAYFEMLERDKERFTDTGRRTNVMPLGSGALAGSGLPIDRELVAHRLDFPEISNNSLDAVSDRDFVLEFMAASSILMTHLSRFCEELILWSSSEFNFIELSDAFCTGSSMMPNKKNPDIPELVRGKTGRVHGALFSLLTVMKGLPLAYNKDMQEDKELLFDCVGTVKGALTVMTQLISEIKVNSDRMEKASSDGFMLATDLSDYLVKKGMPFRESHRVVGEIVAYCLEKGNDPLHLSLEEYKRFSELFAEDIVKNLGLRASLEAKDIRGGTAPRQVKQALETARKKCA